MEFLEKIMNRSFKTTFFRGVGTCVRVRGQDQKWGAKDMNFKEKTIFLAILVNFYQKLGAVAPPCPPGSNTPVFHS